MTEARSGRKRLGTEGETIARAYLEQHGWRIVAMNFRCSAGEMDVIAEEPTLPIPTLVFVEVKTRRGARHGSPRESVDLRKQQKLATVAQTFLGERAAGGEEPACRFDVVEVFVGADGLSRVVLHRAAFTAE
jgi:putative endonuclease